MPPVEVVTAHKIVATTARVIEVRITARIAATVAPNTWDGTAALLAWLAPPRGTIKVVDRLI
jgi:hypothetical protein